MNSDIAKTITTITNSTKSNAHQSKDKMECGIVTDIVVVNSLSVLKLLTTKDDALLFRRDTLLWWWVKEKRRKPELVSEMCKLTKQCLLGPNF